MKVLLADESEPLSGTSMYVGASELTTVGHSSNLNGGEAEGEPAIEQVVFARQRERGSREVIRLLYTFDEATELLTLLSDAIRDHKNRERRRGEAPR